MSVPDTPDQRGSDWLERVADLEPVEVSVPAVEILREVRRDRGDELARRHWPPDNASER